jgi:predicted metal-dependent phosphoesterase TrpH
MGPVFLTDHDTVEGARRLLQESLVSTVTGQEVTTREGDIIGLFLDEPVDRGLSADEAVAQIKDQGGLVYVPHPFDRRRRALELAALERLRARIDIVEVFNGRSNGDCNRKAEDACQAIGAVRGAGSDAHSLKELGRVYVELEDFEGPSDFLAKLEQARIVRDPPRWRLRLEVAAGFRPGQAVAR